MCTDNGICRHQALVQAVSTSECNSHACATPSCDNCERGATGIESLEITEEVSASFAKFISKITDHQAPQTPLCTCDCTLLM